jgi:Fic/DOC family
VETAGYAYLIEQYQLAALPLPAISTIKDALPDRRTRDLGGQVFKEFGRSYEPEQSLIGHLRFALRYEGLNLMVLSLLFAKTGGRDIRAFYLEQPRSAFARRLGYLYEWLTAQALDISDTSGVPRKAAYVPVLDESLQFGAATELSPRNEKYRVIDNLPGNRDFCPLVTKTPHLTEMVSKGLKQRTLDTLAKYDPSLLLRAAAFLYLKETHSSFEVEREKPSANKAQRFADLLRDAERGLPLSEERFVELQNAVVDPRFAEASYRIAQNWIGEDFGYRTRVDFVPPRPEDVRRLMEGLIALAERLRTLPATIDPVIAATAISFGFVFIHPFMDGNGRLHRYLIHESLCVAGFTPKGIILPVSAVIVANLDRYASALEAFSRPLRDRTSFDPVVPSAPAVGNDAVYFRYFDATNQASFLFDALARTVEHDLDAEISYLLGFDRARRALSSVADWPPHTLETFIRVVHQNSDKLSLNKRKAHFQWMTDEEVTRFEIIVARAFDPNVETEEIVLP